MSRVKLFNVFKQAINCLLFYGQIKNRSNTFFSAVQRLIRLAVPNRALFILWT